MSPSERTASVESRLKRRADALGKSPLLSPERSRALQDQLRDAVHRETFAQARRQRGSFLLGLVAAALLMLGVPEFLALRTMDFGLVTGEVALLDAGGRVFTGSDVLRSGASAATEPVQPLYLEVFAETEVCLAVRIRTKTGWGSIAGQEALQLAAGEDALLHLPVTERPFSILIVTSQRPIPDELLDQTLERFGPGALTERLGCAVDTREIPRIGEQ